MTFLEMTLSGTVMILAVAALRALTLRRLPKGTFVALWWLTAVRLLIPVELPSRFSVYTLLESLRRKAAPTAPAAPAAAPPMSTVTVFPGASEAVPAPVPKPFPVWTAVWLTGAVLLALWFLARYIRWRRRFRKSFPADRPCVPSRRKVRLRVTDQIGAPLTYGILRPVILLPRTLDLTDEEAVSCVLAHEMSHIRRLDGMLKLVLAAALCLHWFNPAVWLLYALANRDMELRCDEAAVLALGEDSRARYALALIRLAELQNECVPLCGFSYKSGMEERIRAIMNIKKRSRLACFIALALVLGITTAFATSAKPAPSDEDLTDAQILAQVSKEAAAQWDELLAPYVPFGLTYAFDDPDHDGNGLTMAFEGREVRGIYDEQRSEWITEHAGGGSYGPDAVELYAVYENGVLTGLRLATEEEQAEFTRHRRLSGDAAVVERLVESVRYDSGNVHFTIPEGEGRWRIFIQGRVMTEDGMGLSVHYLVEESEKAEWVPRMTYSFETADAAYDELIMDVEYGNAAYSYDLTLILPEGAPMAREPLPEGKADIPESVAMIWPVDSDKIASHFGSRSVPGGMGAVDHNGVDIGGMEAGTPIYAAGKGTVKDAGYNAQNGNYVRLDHGSGLETFYAHCQSVLVKTGDAVSLGQTIAAVGSTGRSTGPHLHFEVLVNGAARDPEAFYRDPLAGLIGQESNTDLPIGTPEVKIDEDARSETAPVLEFAPRQGTLAGVDEERSRNQAEEEVLADGAYPRNSKGETYGSALFSRELPDLIEAVNDEGTQGYISRAENSILNISSPEEAVAYMNWCAENDITGRWIPLYDKEHNAIGNFLVGIGSGSGGSVVTSEEFLEAKKNGWPNSKGSTTAEEGPEFSSMDEARTAV